MDESNSPNREGRLRRISPDIVAFVIGLALAWFLRWETTDLVWSLWLGSLVLGYATLLVALAAGGRLAWFVIGHERMEPKHRVPAAAIAVGAGLFLLAFFSLHFCGFHAGHSVFLQQFFPLPGMPSEGFGRAFMNPPLLWWLAFEHLFFSYGIFLIPALIAERNQILKPLTRALAAIRTARESEEPTAKNLREEARAGNVMRDVMGRPYVNVVRMHLLIFFFAFCHFLKIDSFVVYAVVYFVYFFPWREFRGARKQDRVRAA